MKKFLAIFIAVIMLFSMCAIAVSAEDETVEYTETLTFYSVINLSATAISGPSVSYEYALEVGDETVLTTYIVSEEEGVEPTEISTNVNAGIMSTEDDAELDMIVIGTQFSTTDYASEDNTVSQELEFYFGDFLYTEPGYYHYIITEMAPSNVSGLSTWGTSVADVYVIVKLVGDEYIATEILMYPEGDTSVKMDSFVDSYGTTGTTAGGDSIDFHITDTALGDMASKTKDFLFTVTTENVTTGTVFQVLNADGITDYIIQTADGLMYADEEDGVYIASTSPFEFYLNDGEECIIYGVIEGMVFTVSIEDESYDGYSFYARDYGLNGIFDDAGAVIDNSYYIDGLEDLGYVEGEDYTCTYDSGTETYNYAVVDGGKLTSFADEGMDGEVYITQYVEVEDGVYVYGINGVVNYLASLLNDGEYHEGYTNSWNSITSSYSVTVDPIVLQVGDTSDDYNLWTLSDVGIDFATVKGEELGEEPDDTGITYDEELPTTGIILEIAPYALMVLLAAAFVVLRAMSARKKQWA